MWNIRNNIINLSLQILLARAGFAVKHFFTILISFYRYHTPGVSGYKTNIQFLQHPDIALLHSCCVRVLAAGISQSAVQVWRLCSVRDDDSPVSWQDS